MRIVMLGPSIERAKGGIASVEKLILQSVPANVEITHIATHVYGSALDRIYVFTNAIIQLITCLISRKQKSIYHIHLSQRGSAFRVAILALLISLFKQPFIIHAHSSQFHIFYDELSPLLQQSLSSIFRRCARFITLSRSWYKYYIESLDLSEKQAVVLSNPVQLPELIPERPSGDPINIIFLGRIGQRKGAFDLIRAFAAIPDQHRRRVKLLMGGDGEVELARKLVAELDLEQQVTVRDWINAEQRDQLLEQSHIFILPSYNEGLPIALLEAMGWGLASITTPVGGIPELVADGENGLLIEPGNIEELSAAMQHLIMDSALRAKLGANARKSVEPLDIKHYCSSLLEIYQSVTQGR